LYAGPPVAYADEVSPAALRANARSGRTHLFALYYRTGPPRPTPTTAKISPCCWAVAGQH